MRDPFVVVGRRLGMTAGQTWTSVLGLGLGAALLGTSLPPVIDQRNAPAPVAAAASAQAPAAPSAGVVVPPASTAPSVPLAPLAPPALSPDIGAAPPPAPGPAAAPAFAPPAPAPVDPPGVTPLVVRAGGFSTTDPAPVASGPGDPAGLPVSVRLGSAVETSYVRLSGTATVLRLGLSDAQGAQVQPQTAVVRACRIATPDWRAGRPQAPVPYSASDCVPGRPQPGGSYAFDLAAYPDRTGAAGFALAADLSGGSSPDTSTYRITFVGQRTS